MTDQVTTPSGVRAVTTSVVSIVALVAEDAVHDGGAAADRRHEHMTVDGVGDAGGPVAQMPLDPPFWIAHSEY